MKAMPILFAAAVLAGGCAPPPRDAEVRLARVAAERRNLEESLDRLGARLLANQSRVRFWREMRDRHESVSAIACASLEEHAVEMARHAPPRSPLHRARVAAATSPAPARAPAYR